MISPRRRGQTRLVTSVRKCAESDDRSETNGRRRHTARDAQEHDWKYWIEADGRRPLQLSALVSSLTIFAPAKINLFLAITGRRPDGFHNLVSVVAPVEWGDELTVEPAADFSLVCEDPAVPHDHSNLVLKAADAFRTASGWRGGATFSLQKRIPIGAGLGGGSSDAAAALRALNQLAGNILSVAALTNVAARVGSDCALFLHEGPVVMRGRGEEITLLQDSARRRLKGRNVLIFKPAFSISTAWAYARLAAGAPSSYLPPTEAEARLTGWQAGSDGPEKLLYNRMETVAFAKFPALPVLLEQLNRDFGLTAGMSGSGSACFVLLPDGAPIEAICGSIRRAWGDSTFLVRTRLQ